MSAVFKDILETFKHGKEYKKCPPYGPLEELPTLSKEEIEALNFSDFGADPNLRGKNYRFESMNFNIEDRLLPKYVDLPKMSSFEDLHIFGISGNNQKVGRGAFYFLIAKANLLNFRYSIVDRRPYYNNSSKQISALMVVDPNVFRDNLFKNYVEELLEDDVLLQRLYNNQYSKPFQVGYRTDSSASSQALGWGVKLQQTLELTCIKDIPTDRKVICIRGGPLFSTSVAPKIVAETLKPIVETWTNQVYITCSDNVQESHLLIEALTENDHLRELWFPDQKITKDQIKSIGSDLFILDKILTPGQRTPLIEAVERARVQIVQCDERLTPLTCFYRGRRKPYPYLRIEIPKHSYQSKKNLVEEAIDILVWQYELGKRAPLIQNAAKQLSRLSSDRFVLEKQTSAALEKFELNFPTEE